MHARCWGEMYHNFLYTQQGARDVMTRPEGGRPLEFLHGKTWRSKSAHNGWVACDLCRGPYHNNESWEAMCHAIDAEQANAPEGAGPAADVSGPEGELRELVITKQEQFIVYLTGANADKAVLVPGAVAGMSGAHGQISNEKPMFHATLRSTIDSVLKPDGQRLFQWDDRCAVVGGCGRWRLIADLPEWARDLPVPPESKLTSTKPSDERVAQGKPGALKLKLTQECVPWVMRRAAPRTWADEPTILYANRQAWPARTLEWRRLNAPEGDDEAMLGGDPAAVAGALQLGAGADEAEGPVPEEEVVGGAVEEEPPAEDEEAEENAAAAMLGIVPVDQPVSEEEQAALIAIAYAADAAAAERVADLADYEERSFAEFQQQQAVAEAACAHAEDPIQLNDDVAPPMAAAALQPKPPPPAPAVEPAALADWQEGAAARRAQLRAAAEARMAAVERRA